jgi:transcriptional regulator with XRE-family HTH domain
VYNNVGLTRESNLYTLRTPPLSPIVHSVGSRIVISRISQEITQAELCKLVERSQAQISSIENDKATPTIATIRKLAKALNVHISYIGCFENLPENTFGKRITKARLYLGLTKKELAHQIGVDVKTIKNWENDSSEPLEKFRPQIDILFSVLRMDGRNDS